MTERTILDAIIDAIIEGRPMTITILEPAASQPPTREPIATQPPRRRSCMIPRRGG